MTTKERGLSRRTLLTSSGALVAVGGFATVASPHVARAQAKTPVTLAIQFFARGDYASYYLARERGYYAEAGLDVTIKHVLGNALALQTLTAGNAHVVHADLVQMLQLQGNTPDPQMRSLAVVADKLALSLFYLKGKSISKPQDLEGRSIVDSPGSTAPFLFNLFARASTIDPKKVSWKNAAATAKVALMLQGEADAVAIYLQAKPGIDAKLQATQEIGYFTFGDSVPIYGDGLISTEKYWQDNKKTTQAFIRATMKGCKDSFADPTAAIEAIAKHFPELDKATGKKEMEIMAQVANGPAQQAKGLGYHEPEKIAATYDAVRSVLGQPIARPVTDLYTNEAI
jgi:NitT/TauT family transport system substrate-binding protein